MTNRHESGLDGGSYQYNCEVKSSEGETDILGTLRSIKEQLRNTFNCLLEGNLDLINGTPEFYARSERKVYDTATGEELPVYSIIPFRVDKGSDEFLKFTMSTDTIDPARQNGASDTKFISPNLNGRIECKLPKDSWGEPAETDEADVPAPPAAREDGNF